MSNVQATQATNAFTAITKKATSSTAQKIALMSAGVLGAAGTGILASDVYAGATAAADAYPGIWSLIGKGAAAVGTFASSTVAFLKGASGLALRKAVVKA